MQTLRGAGAAGRHAGLVSRRLRAAHVLLALGVVMGAALTVLLVLHAAIHLLGFVKPWKLAAVPQLSGRAIVPLTDAAARGVGLLWLAATLLLLGAAALRVMHHGAWAPVALAGVVLSQALVVLQWRDAKAGTLPNVVLVVVAVVAVASARFHARAGDEARALVARAPAAAPVVTAEDVGRLPAPVRRWLEASGAVGRRRASTLRLTQRGLMRTSPGGAWMPAEAEQHFTVEEPGFVWRVDVTMMGFVPVVGRDRYAAGKGSMVISAAGLVTMVDATGPEIDQGTLLRFLGESVWMPSAALAPYIRWEPVDAASARATMTYGGVAASGVFTFDARGRVTSMTADRYMGGGGGGAAAKLERWFIPMTEWRAVRGVEIPVRGSVTWKLADGDFEYYRWEILDAEQDAGQPGGGGSAGGPSS